MSEALTALLMVLVGLAAAFWQGRQRGRTEARKGNAKEAEDARRDAAAASDEDLARKLRHPRDRGL